MFDLLNEADNIAFWRTLNEDGFLEWSREFIDQNGVKPLEDDYLKTIWRDANSAIKKWLINSWDELPETLQKAIVLAHASGILRGIYTEFENE